MGNTAIPSPDRTVTCTPIESLGEGWNDVSWYGRDGGLLISKESQVILLPSEDVLSLLTERIGMSHPTSEVLDEVWSLLHGPLPIYHPLALEQSYLLNGLAKPKMILKQLYGYIDDFAQAPDHTQYYMIQGKVRSYYPLELPEDPPSFYGNLWEDLKDVMSRKRILGLDQSEQLWLYAVIEYFEEVSELHSHIEGFSEPPCQAHHLPISIPS